MSARERRTEHEREEISMAASRVLRPLTTQLVGSYAKPHWLARHDRAFEPDGRWRPEAEVLPEAIADATRLAVTDQARAGLDLITDGEQGRQTYTGHLIARLDGIDSVVLGTEERPGGPPAWVEYNEAWRSGRHERAMVAPRVVGPIRWPGPISTEEVRRLRRLTRKTVKFTVPCPMTAAWFLVDEYYGDEQALTAALAETLNQELRATAAAGVDLIQIDEPSVHFNLDGFQRHGAMALERMIANVDAPIAVHVCYGYANLVDRKHLDPDYETCLAALAACDFDAISLEYEQPGEPDLLRACGDKHVILGLLNMGTHEVEAPVHVAARLRAALDVIPPERLHLAPDCGMWHLPRNVSAAKLRALVIGTELVRAGLDA